MERSSERSLGIKFSNLKGEKLAQEGKEAARVDEGVEDEHVGKELEDQVARNVVLEDIANVVRRCNVSRCPFGDNVGEDPLCVCVCVCVCLC